MKPEDDVKQFYQKIVVKTDPEADERVLEKVLAAHKTTKTHDSIWNRLSVGSLIMKSPTAKLAIAAGIIMAVVLGLFEFMGGNGGSGVVWAEVAKKVQASGSLILRIRETGSVSLDDSDYAIKHFSPAGSRTDAYKDGQITRSNCSNTETKTATFLFHATKTCISRQLEESSEGFLEKEENWTNPKYLVQQILSVEHKELSEKMIDGVLCEGLETSDPAVMGPLAGMVDSLEVHMKLWVDVQTQYPVRFEGQIKGEAEGEVMESDCVIDQFQWDVEIDPSLFELEIPADYEQI
jgi:hypothetical protein